MSRLISREVADAVRAGAYNPQGHEAVLQLAPKPPFFTLTVEEAQDLLQRSRFSDNPRVAAFVPLLCVHFGRWWHYVESVMAGLAGPWINRFLLKWKSPDSLDMRVGNKDVVRHIRWTNGREAGLYRYDDAGSGTRVSVPTRFLKEVLSEYDLLLLTTDHVTVGLHSRGTDVEASTESKRRRR